eukprot:CAMPEP_0172629010 /NCGR_PEP_ID=MMETSP1068-20121228/165097_1 /TAXON_ID=35684 /ORGANISM="Pseudopedinella elastica, Strain CCMP716" /LENGTH=162 /DNA_ID=CAMNT_0013439419 /DNA_START=9 /DNA_END=494 /DNA_ORIENTATION=+
MKSSKGQKGAGPKKNSTRDEKTGKAPPVVTDGRFQGMHSAPTFQRIKRDKHKVKLDPRFSAVLNDERFQVPGGKYDKYGRKQDAQDSKDDLSAFYALEEDGYDNFDDLAEAEAELEASKDKSTTGKRKGLKPKPAVLKRQKMKPGEKLPAEEMERRLGYLNR